MQNKFPARARTTAERASKRAGESKELRRRSEPGYAIGGPSVRPKRRRLWNSSPFAREPSEKCGVGGTTAWHVLGRREPQACAPRNRIQCLLRGRQFPGIRQRAAKVPCGRPWSERCRIWLLRRSLA